MLLGWLPEDISTFGPHIDSMLRLIFSIVGTFFILAEGTLLAFIIAYRRRRGGRASFVDGESLPQLLWVLIPVVIVVFFDVYLDTRAKPIWDEVKMNRPPAALTVKLAALQFGWEFTYPGPDGKFGTGNDLVQTTVLTVPSDRVVQLIMSSKDVIHSFYVPQLRLRQDAVPGREIPVWFQATKPGKYEIGCSQLCGISHFAMKGILHVLSPDDFDKWLSDHRQKTGGTPSASSADLSANGKEG